VEVMAAVVEKHIEDKLKGVTLDVHDEECLRAQVIGKKDGRNVECTVDCLVATHSRWGVSHATSVPPAIAAEMQVEGDVEPGVWGPEQAIDPVKFFKELGKREMRIQVTRKEDVT
jgi:saccharopine dehydrogenase-like NADP-dependent oxidoreductase